MYIGECGGALVPWFSGEEETRRFYSSIPECAYQSSGVRPSPLPSRRAKRVEDFSGHLLGMRMLRPSPGRRMVSRFRPLNPSVSSISAGAFGKCAERNFRLALSARFAGPDLHHGPVGLPFFLRLQ